MTQLEILLCIPTYFTDILCGYIEVNEPLKNDLVLNYSFIAQVLTAKNSTTDKNLPRKKPGQSNSCFRISINSITLVSLRDFIQLASKTFRICFVRKLTSQVVSIPEVLFTNRRVKYFCTIQSF